MKINDTGVKQKGEPFRRMKNLLRGLQSLESAMLNNQGIGLEEAVLLCCISERCKCQGNIATETGLSFTQASRMLSKLETKGLLKREIDPDDKRKMLFTLSGEGQQKLDAVTPLVDAYLETK